MQSSFSFRKFETMDTVVWDQYRSLKYAVFVEELGWNLPSEGTKVIRDKFDQSSVFVGAFDSSDCLVGVARGSRMSPMGLPWEQLIKHHLLDQTVSKFVSSVLTSLAVAKPLRGRLVNGQTIGSTLVDRVLRELSNLNSDVCWVTTSMGANVKFFYRRGFLLADPPFEFPAPVGHAVNLARFLRHDQIEDHVLFNYLKQRQSGILRKNTLSEFLVDFKTHKF